MWRDRPACQQRSAIRLSSSAFEEENFALRSLRFLERDLHWELHDLVWAHGRYESTRVRQALSLRKVTWGSVYIDRDLGCCPRPAFARSGRLSLLPPSPSEREANDSLACEENGGKSKGDKGGRRGRRRRVDDRDERAARSE